MKKITNKRNIYIVIAIITILLIGLGYAFLTSNLNIIGNTNINKNTWGVEFENINVTEGSVEADTPQISNKTTVNYTVTLDKPGDYYEFNVDAVNKGSIDAMIDTVSNTGLTPEQKKYLTYTATYTSGKEIKPKQELKAGSKEKIQVRVEFKKDITAEDLPSENQQLNLTLTIEYVQADDSAEPTNQPVCKRATKLHTEICNSNSGCTISRYNVGDTITYGSLGTAGTLTSGDAFDCDVNGDGIYNSSNERFYYVTSLDTDSNYGVLIYYSSVTRGGPSSTDSASYDYDGRPRENGPGSAVQLLPTTTQWKNVRLSNNTRKIKDEVGEEYIDFLYKDRNPHVNLEVSARLLTYQEVISACGSGDPTQRGYLDSCNYLLEQTAYSSVNEKTWGYWLETLNSNYSDSAWCNVGDTSLVTYMISNDTYWRSVRPVIEVEKSKISY